MRTVRPAGAVGLVTVARVTGKGLMVNRNG